MRIKDIITEARLGTVQAGEFSVAVSEHIIARVHQRRIPVLAIGRILDRLVQVKDKIASLDENQTFWLHDQSLGISLGMRKFTGTNLLLATAIHGAPRKSDVATVLTV